MPNTTVMFQLPQKIPFSLIKERMKTFPKVAGSYMLLGRFKRDGRCRDSEKVNFTRIISVIISLQFAILKSSL